VGEAQDAVRPGEVGQGGLERAVRVVAGGHVTGDEGRREPAAVDDLVGGQRAEQAQQVDDALDVAGPAVGGEALQLELVLVDDVGVEQLAELGAAEQLLQQARVERQGGRTPLGEG
jgi:hypothetical protein